MTAKSDRKSTRLNSSHTNIYTLSLHDALPISSAVKLCCIGLKSYPFTNYQLHPPHPIRARPYDRKIRSEEHTSELQSHQYLHSFPTRRSSDLKRSQTLLHWAKELPIYQLPTSPSPSHPCAPI